MAHRRKKTIEGGSAPVQLSLIITPMLDMSFQILAFFIMTYHPSALEGHIAGTLAPPEQVKTKGPNNEINPLEDPLSVPEDDLLPNEALQIKIKAVAKGQEIGSRLEGQPSQLYIKQVADAQPVMLADMLADGNVDFETALKRLDLKLKEIVKESPPLKPGETSKLAVKIEGDTDLRQQYIMAVYDTCKKSGFGKLHLVPPPVLKTTLMK